MRSILLFLCILIASGCRSPRITTAWKADHAAPLKYSKIVVVGITKGGDDSLRVQVERYFALALNNLGYKAVSAVVEFGPKGLANLGEVDTYRKLCNDGIDVVMTFALIDGNKEPRQKYRKIYGYPSNYYYNRIWNYKNILADMTGDNNTGDRYFWESILFNLNTLEAECTIQTRSFKDIRLAKRTHEFQMQVIQKMIREKVLEKQPPKPF
ncbi:MAG: hypothetical protein Q8941_01950 [Bacteroidota bacterium]|nr:hypothetical protein [Bacteroidota bacterium]